MLLNLKNAMTLRRVRGYELAAKLGIPAPVLSQTIHGQRKANAAFRRRAARLLHAPEDWLFLDIFVPDFRALPETGEGDRAASAAV